MTDEVHVTVVPEMSGTVLIDFLTDDTGAVHVYRFPVIAWRITGVEVDPVVCEDPSEHYCLEVRASGEAPCWVFPFQGTYASWHEAQAFGEAEARAAWERIKDQPRLRDSLAQLLATRHDH